MCRLARGIHRLLGDPSVRSRKLPYRSFDPQRPASSSKDLHVVNALTGEYGLQISGERWREVSRAAQRFLRGHLRKSQEMEVLWKSLPRHRSSEPLAYQRAMTISQTACTAPGHREHRHDSGTRHPTVSAHTRLISGTCARTLALARISGRLLSGRLCVAEFRHTLIKAACSARRWRAPLPGSAL
jgi:hypothetical protein